MRIVNNIQELYSDAQNGIHSVLSFGNVNNEFAKRIGLKINGYEITLNSDELNHILNRHGSTDEFKKGQIPVNLNDIQLIPEIILNHDNFEVENGKRNLKNIVFYKTFLNKYKYIVEVRTGKKQLAGVTLYIKLPGTIDADSTSTSKTIPGLDYKDKEDFLQSQLGKSYIRMEFDNTKEMQKFLKPILQENKAIEENFEKVLDKMVKEGKEKNISKKIELPKRRTQKEIDSERKALKKLGLEGKQTKKPKMQHQIGAVEVLKQNKTYKGFANYKPTYKILTDYSHLIAKPLHKSKVLDKNGSLDDTIRYIKEIVSNNHWQVKGLALHLKDNDRQQTIFNIWHWLRSNIPFSNEPDEILRTPARSYHIDRFTGIDCDDYSIFASCILTQLRIEHQFDIVAFHNKINYGHIYVVVENTVLDSVMKEFDKHPDFITKRRIIPMKITMLSGLPAREQSSQTQNPATIGMLKRYDQLRKKLYTTKKNPYPGQTEENLKREMRKLRTAILFDGSPMQEDIVNIMPLVYDIKLDGTVYMKRPEYADIADDYISGIESMMGLGDIEGLGKIRNAFKKVKKAVTKVHNKAVDLHKKAGKKIVDTAKKVHKKAVEVHKKVGKEALNVAKKVTKVVKKVSLAPARHSFLLLLAVNFLGMARKMYFGYLTEKEATEKGLDIDEWKKAVKSRENIEKFYKKAGGDLKTLKNAVMKGRGKKAAQKKLDKAIKGLGEPTTIASAAAVASSTPLWSKVLAFFKNVNWGKLIQKAKDAKDKFNVKEADDAENEAIENAENIEIDTENTEITSTGTTGKTNWILPVAAIGIVAVLLFK